MVYSKGRENFLIFSTDLLSTEPSKEVSVSDSFLAIAKLLPVSTQVVGDEDSQTVDARKLHTFLKVGAIFANWMKDRIEQYGFLANKDFSSYFPNGKEPQGGRPSTEYALTLDMAKQLAMVERNDMGKQARLYFIECEKQLRAILARPRNILDDLDVLIAAKQEIVAGKAREKALQGQNAVLAEEVKEMLPDKAYCAATMEADEDRKLLDFGRMVCPYLGMGPGQAVNLLKPRFLFKQGREWLPRAGYVKGANPLFRRSNSKPFIDARTGKETTKLQTYVTAEGQRYFFRLWNIDPTPPEIPCLLPGF